MSRSVFAKAVSSVSVLALFPLAYANPLGFPEYEQTVEVECGSALEAQNVTLEMLPLPDGATIAFSTRWDDTNTNAFPKAEMLQRAGTKGGFYLVGAARCGETSAHWRNLLDRGHAIGNHTVWHRFMHCLSPNAAFREILENRIMLEQMLDHSVISYVSPYGWGSGTIDRDFASRTAKMLVNTGHWVTCDNPETDWNIPESIWYPSQRFSADDRNPQWDLFSVGLARQEKIAAANRISPRVVLGTHAWCDESGNQKQEKWIRENCVRDDWVQLNDYEYGAYRYSYLNGSVTKISVNGNKAVFGIKRFDPASLSDAVPLSIRFSCAVRHVNCGGVELEAGKNGTWKLAHDRRRQLLDCIGLANANGVAAKASGIAVVVAYDGKEGKMVVTARNTGCAKVTDVFGVAYLPPTFGNGRITFEVPEIAVGKTMTREFICKATDKETTYDPADAFLATSIDFSDGNQRKRIWATTSVCAGERPKLPREVAKWTLPASLAQLDDAFLQDLSVGRWAIPVHNGVEWDTGSLSNGSWYNASWHSLSFESGMYSIVNGKEDKYQAVVLQFKLNHGQRAMARSDVFSDKSGVAVFFNGRQLPVSGKDIELPAVEGSNRIVIRRKIPRGNYSLPIQLAVFNGGISRPLPCEDIPDGLYAGDTKYGEKTRLWTIRGKGGLTMEVLDCGGKVNRLLVPDKSGKKVDVTIGFDHPSGWENTDAYFGAIIGRVGNRIANGKFSLDGKDYSLAVNDTAHHANLHGGKRGWNDYVWDVEPFAIGNNRGIVFRRVSPDGEEGFPGRMEATVVYTITPDNTWRIDYEAVTDKATPVNLTQHVYFDMNGDASILSQELMINADKYTPVDEDLRPTGAIANVEGTPFDFREFHKIGERIDADDRVLQFGPGYDHNWVLNGVGFRKVAELRGASRAVEVWTDQPGLQFYAGNFIKDDWVMKDSRKMKRRGWIALETQHYPNTPNQKNFPSITLKPGETYRTRTEYRFKNW